MNRHDLANLEQIALLTEGLKEQGLTVGSGYRPSAWCLNPGCHAPVAADALHCPECATPHPRLCPCGKALRPDGSVFCESCDSRR
ncbi:hypothetical protein IHN63_06640 [Deinococcus sp. 6YEL10]|uniref:hypothetical protein n=1 Tax=Deinococcus sp. 6YEL10 TaxID=2745870 RepID=UPI001E29B904|nr:hypothetical protein [Deinococcus sp. 6YEL10]MCD0160987.1 hypothetical protein [Deinococcus sp. 6YEL10]